MRVQGEMITPFFYMVLALPLRPEEHYYFFMLATWALVGKDGKWIRAMPIPTWRNPRLPAVLGLPKLVIHLATLFYLVKGMEPKAFKTCLLGLSCGFW